jgi:hypothetical protein
MVKTILIQGIISLFIVFGFVAEPVTVTLNMPDTAKAGAEFLVEVNIKKGDYEGFARFQQELPVGFKAVARQTSNGDFSFQDQKVKIQWMKVPTDREITVSYAIQIDPVISGPFTFEGKFSYILDNAVQTVNIDPKVLTVQGDEMAAGTDNSQTTYTYQNVNLKNVDCIRQKPYLNENNEIIVNLMVNKGDLKDYGKIQEQVPIGYTAESIKSKNSIFTFKNHIIKFLWMNMPAEPQFIVSYKLVPESNNIPDQAFIISGNFSYAENERTKTINIAERNVDLNNFEETQMVAQNNTTTSSNRDNTLAQNTQSTSNTNNASTTQSLTTQQSTQTDISLNNNTYTDYTTTSTNTSTTSSASNQNYQAQSRPSVTYDEASGVPMPEEGVSYRVQIAAGHKLVDKNYFKRLNVTDQVQVEIHDGWNKYTIGNFTKYLDARDYRVYVWNNTPIHDAFVAAYNNGLRITVQEALMIANQKWYK